LREVRVDGEIGDHVRCDAVLEVGAEIGLHISPGNSIDLLVEDVEPEGRERRLDLEVEARRQVRHAGEDAHLSHKPRDIARDGRPDNGLVLRPDATDDLKPPPVWHAGCPDGIAKTLERNGHLGREPVVDGPTGCVEQCVP
jgi:hypothetical protein